MRNYVLYKATTLVLMKKDLQLCSVSYMMTLGIGFALLFLGCNQHAVKEVKKWPLREHTVKPHWSEEDQTIPFLVASLPKNVPRRFFLPKIPKAGDQGSQASGTAWACGYFAATYIYHQKNEKSNYQCAPAFIYNSLNKGLDRGIEIVNALQFLKDYGCANEKYAPYRTHDFAFKPNSRSLKDAANYRIQGFGRVDYFDLDQIRGHLLQKRPIVVTLVISDNFITFNELVWEQPQGEQRGRHSIALIGYDDEKELFFFLNSAGMEWGENGRVAIPYSWFIRLARQAYVLW